MENVLTKTPRIAIQGIPGAFHEIAARQFFGDHISLEACDSFPILFRSLNEEKADFGVMAIENSVAGTILPNYALLRNSKYTITGEVYLRIEHQLMALPGQTIEDIHEVHSHPMAILQCQTFFEAYPDIKLIETSDTAESARNIQQKQLKGIAAIAGEIAAKHYELDILHRGIETHKRNFTRFLILKEKGAITLDENLLNKASLSFNLSHQVGSLSQILLVLGSHGMNLTKIQSLPVVGREWQYFFHIDLEFESYQQYKLALSAVRSLVDELKILGEYPKGNK